MRLSLKLSLSLVVFLVIETASAAGAFGPPTRIRPSQRLQTPDCEEILAYAQPALEETLQSLGARRGSAHFGYYNEIEKLLFAAGVRANSARSIAAAIEKLQALAFNSDFLSFSAGIFDHLIKNEKLLVCVFSPNCSLANAPNNFVMFTQPNKEAIILLPVPKTDQYRFAINFLGSFSSLAGEYFLDQWMVSNLNMTHTNPEEVDAFYKEYVPGFDGSHPLKPNSPEMRFAITFLSIYQTYITARLFEFVIHDDVERNRKHLAEASLYELTQGRNSDLTAGIVKSLGLNTQNYYDKIEELLTEMNLTIVRTQ